MKKTVYLELSPPIKAELDKGVITREDIERQLRHDFGEYYALKNNEKLRGPDRARILNQIMDHLLGAFEREENKDVKSKISCRKGCSACCFIEVTVTWDEAALLFEVAGDRIDWDKIADQLPGHKNIAHYKRECVFLKDHECTVHADRPLSCRKYFVTNDPELCDSKKYPQGGTEIAYLRPAEMLASSMMTIQETGTLAEMLTKVRAKAKK